MPFARALLYVGGASGLALLLRSVLYSPPSVFWSLVFLAAYIGWIVLGVLVPSLEMFADVVWRGPEGARGVALTFDDGPHPVFTRQVLAMLASRGVKATFFVVGEKASRFPDVVLEIKAAGHDVGLHSFAHDRLFSLRGRKKVFADLDRGLRVLSEILGQAPRLFRPPIGHVSPPIAAVSRSLGLTIVGFSVRGLDGLPWTTADGVVRRISKGLRDGAIVLLHDAPERGDDPPASIAALASILDGILRQQLETVRLDDWLRHSE